VSGDPLDERAAELFEAARQEPAPEATRQRIAAALRARPKQAIATESRRSGWPIVRVTLAVAAAALVAGAMILKQRAADSVDISAEVLTPPTAEERTVAPVQVPPVPSAAVSAAPRPTVKRAPARAPASLEQELASVQRARAALGRGDALAALAELDRFDRGPGWRRLAVEARLLRIEALAQAGRADEARDLARRFVEQHPNNPLVDRARAFAAPPSPSGVAGP
jgi:hypothetical protein